jgi:hypothetical protein
MTHINEKANIPLDAAAVLIWLPKGMDPLAKSFSFASIEAPPHPNPEPWWECQQAIEHAASLVHDDDKLPWIKVGGLLLSPEEIFSIVATLRKR